MANTCAICLDTLACEISKLESCAHEFCLTCIREWAKSNNSCPLCKRKFHRIHSNKRVFIVCTPNKPSSPVVFAAADSFITLNSTAFDTDSEDSDYVSSSSSSDDDSFDEDDEMEFEDSVINLISSDDDEEIEILD